ncbi:hypothetical protein TIFTF001_011605 [Ficus carica]|uniref:Uncharacterized protein n=1 Tax=Ficus carica TaxID=3494 RepID=A0AA87ZYY1_FICCA|nr:hypothetical protein TIFTF001_011605 [Ficus carica]
MYVISFKRSHWEENQLENSPLAKEGEGSTRARASKCVTGGGGGGGLRLGIGRDGDGGSSVEERGRSDVICRWKLDWICGEREREREETHKLRAADLGREAPDLWRLAMEASGEAPKFRTDWSSMNGSPQAPTSAVGSVVAIVGGGGQELEGATIARSSVAVVGGHRKFVISFLCRRWMPSPVYKGGEREREILPSPEMDAIVGICKEGEREKEGGWEGEFFFIF